MESDWDMQEIFDVVDLAKKDIYEPINKLEAVNNAHANDYVYTYQKIFDRLKKWFGDST